MGNKRCIISFVLLCLMAFHAFPFANNAYANGAVGALGLGGLEFIQENDISIDKEILKITPQLVSVKYQFRNNSDKDKRVLIVFPLPPSDNHRSFSGLPYNFKVTVSGEQINAGAEYRAFVHDGKEEVTDLLKHYGIPIYGASVDKTTEIMNSLDEESRDKLHRKGCFARTGVTIFRWQPSWSIETKYYWEQEFPAAKIIEIAVSYSPLSGSSDLFTLSNVLSSNKIGSDNTKRCSSGETEWVESVLQAHPGYDANEISLENWFVEYILGTGSYWSGPIKDFELDVSGRGYAGICFDMEIDGEIKRISNSRIKVNIQDFEPKGNLYVHFYSVQGVHKGGLEEY